MVIDTSAVVAILLGEPDGQAYSDAIGSGDLKLMSALNVLEASMVIEGRKGVAGAERLEAFLIEAEVQVVAFDAVQSRVARAAWRRFGKGNHPASLNLADCCAYALAIVSGEPLLYKGNDFVKTGVRSALPRDPLPS